MDIYDIPIAKITDDFLGYIHTLESLNLDVASEFILVAATLMRIKAKMLIPRKELDEEGNEILNKDGSVKVFDAPDLDWSHIAEYVELEDLEELK